MNVLRMLMWACFAGAFVALVMIISSPANAKIKDKLSYDSPYKELHFTRNTCSGTYIAPNIIVTAAHCVGGYSLYRDKIVVDGFPSSFRLIYLNTKIGLINVDGVAVIKLLDTKYEYGLAKSSKRAINKDDTFSSDCVGYRRGRPKRFTHNNFKLVFNKQNHLMIGFAKHPTAGGCSGAALVNKDGDIQGVLLYTFEFRGENNTGYYLFDKKDRKVLNMIIRRLND